MTILKKSAIVLLVLLLIAALLVGSWYLTKLNGWPLWVGGAIIIGLLGLLLLFIFIRRQLLRSNEKAFVKRVIAQEGDAVFAAQDDHTLLIEDLEKQWQKAIDTLYRSKLSKAQNPVYALPWILVIGESGAGKTSMLKNSRLSSAVTDVEASAQYAGTKNCDWWFFEDAVILDTAGRYSIPLEEKKDNAEWERFLSLLSKHRKNEPLNGLVVTVSVERLLENDKEIIQADALSIRKRINQLMVTIGAKFPVYLMITKMDRIYGFTDFCDALPETLQRQAMGFLNESANEHWDEVIDEALGFVKEKVSDLQLLSVEQQAKRRKEILLFSKEFDQITPALKAFTEVVFGEDTYQKIPMLRGVYFSSALSDGSSSSIFLSEYDLPQSSEKPQNKACFIQEFFKVILPSDRNIYTPIKEYLTWQRRNYKIALGAWLLLFISLAGIYSYSYIQNVAIISQAKEVKNHLQPLEKMPLTSRILELNEMRMNIIKITESNAKMDLPLLSFRESRKAEAELKALYRKSFYDAVYRTFRYNLQHSVENIDLDTPSKEVVSYIGFLIDTISISKQTDIDIRDLNVSPYYLKWLQNILKIDAPEMDESVDSLFMNEYIAYQVWSDDTLRRELIKDFRMLIISTIDHKGEDLHWLADEGVSQTPSLKITDLFQGANFKSSHHFPTLSGSLTEAGRKNLIENIKILVDEVPEDKRLQKNLKLFWAWYDERFYYHWKNFIIAMNEAQDALKPHNQEQLLYTMTNEKNPYFDLIHTMAKEFKAYHSPNKTPPWTKLVIELDTIMTMAETMRNAKNSLLAKVTDEKDALFAKAEAEADQSTVIRQIKSASIFSKYLDELTKLSAVVDPGASSVIISDFFSGSQSKSTTASLRATHELYKKFIHSLPEYPNTKPIEKLLSGPKDYIIDYTIVQLDVTLNEKWENDVLGAIPLSSDKELLMSLFDKQKGLVWKYVDGPLRPFVRRDRYGYHIKKVAGYKVDILPEFLRYINSGINLLNAYKPEYEVSIQTLPFNINEDAQIEPDYVNLHLRCAKSDYILKNENYSLTKVFEWVPGKCGDVVMTFGFKGFSLQKSYRGDNAFLYFLKEFRSGTRLFRRSDFDRELPELEQYNIRSIQVSYNISNEGKILRLLDPTPYRVPQKVVGVR